MFSSAYFPSTYYAPTYFPEGVAYVPPPPPPPPPPIPAVVGGGAGWLPITDVNRFVREGELRARTQREYIERWRRKRKKRKQNENDLLMLITEIFR